MSPEQQQQQASVPSGNAERTFIMVKPDGVQRGLIGEIMRRFESRGYQLIAAQLMRPSKQLLEEHYADLAGKPFFPGMIAYMQTGPVMAMVFDLNSFLSYFRLCFFDVFWGR